MSGLGIMEAQKLGRRMVGVERKRACGSVGACEKGRVEMRVVRQAAGVRSSWRMRIEDSMAGFVGVWGFVLKCGRVQMGSFGGRGK